MEIYESKQTGLATGAMEVITVDDVKAWSVVETSLDDAVITAIIVSAREMVENFLSKDMVSKNRILFVDEPEDSENTVILPYNAKDGTIAVNVNGTDLTEGDDYCIVGIGNKYIRLTTYGTNITVTYESDPISSPSELELAKSATKVLIEQIYDNRANLEGDEDIMILDRNVKIMLNPIRTMYL